MTDLSPTVRRRELGTRLRELRTTKGLTVEDVARELLCSPTKISRVETGARPATLHDIRDLCQLYGVDAETSAELMELAREVRQQGWWTKYDDLEIMSYVGIEQSATTITTFRMYYVPGLLHTEDYARTIIKSIAPKIDVAILTQRVEARMTRQKLLQTPKPPKYRALLDEAVLHRHLGGPAVMKAQLDKGLSSTREKRARFRLSRTRSAPTGLSTAISSFWNSRAPGRPMRCSLKASSAIFIWNARKNSSDIVRRSTISATKH